MTFVGKVTEGFKERMIATFYYSTLPFAAVPVFYDKVTSLTGSEETDSDINKVLSIFMPVVAILGDAFLILIGLISLALASVAALVQTLFLPVELLVASIEDGWSSEEEYVAGNPDNLEPGKDVTADYQKDLDEDMHHEEDHQISQDANYDIPNGQYQDGHTYATEHQNVPNFWAKPTEQKPFRIDPAFAEEFLRKYGSNS